MSAFTDRMHVLEYKEQLRQAEKRRKEREMEQREKEVEKIAKKKQQEKEKKEYERTICLAITQDLRFKFEQDFALQGLKAKYTFYNIETRNNIIKSIAKTEYECDFLEKNYNKILNEVIKKYELNEKYKEEQIREIEQQEIERMQPIWEAEQKKREIKQKKEKQINILIDILKYMGLTIKWAIIIFLGAIYLLLKFIASIGK